MAGMDKRVGLRLRLPTLLIDAVALWIVIAAAQQLATLAITAQPQPANLQAGRRWVGVWFLLLVAPPLAGVMYTLCDVFFAATPGRALLRLRVADETGRRASRRQLLARWAIRYAPLTLMAAWIGYFAVHVALTNGRGLNDVVYAQWFVLPAIGVVTLAVCVGGLLAMKKPMRQALHDRLARTAVFRRADVTSASFEPVFAAAAPVVRSPGTQ